MPMIHPCFSAYDLIVPSEQPDPKSAVHDKEEVPAPITVTVAATAKSPVTSPAKSDSKWLHPSGETSRQTSTSF